MNILNVSLVNDRFCLTDCFETRGAKSGVRIHSKWIGLFLSLFRQSVWIDHTDQGNFYLNRYELVNWIEAKEKFFRIQDSDGLSYRERIEKIQRVSKSLRNHAKSMPKEIWGEIADFLPVESVIALTSASREIQAKFSEYHFKGSLQRAHRNFIETMKFIKDYQFQYSFQSEMVRDISKQLLAPSDLRFSSVKHPLASHLAGYYVLIVLYLKAAMKRLPYQYPLSFASDVLGRQKGDPEFYNQEFLRAVDKILEDPWSLAQHRLNYLHSQYESEGGCLKQSHPILHLLSGSSFDQLRQIISTLLLLTEQERTNLLTEVETLEKKYILLFNDHFSATFKNLGLEATITLIKDIPNSKPECHQKRSWLLLCRNLSKNGEIKAAREIIETYLPDDFKAIAFESITEWYLENLRVEEAIEYLEQVSFAYNYKSLALIAKYYRKTSQLAKAEEIVLIIKQEQERCWALYRVYEAYKSEASNYFSHKRDSSVLCEDSQKALEFLNQAFRVLKQIAPYRDCLSELSQLFDNYIQLEELDKALEVLQNYPEDKRKCDQQIQSRLDNAISQYIDQNCFSIAFKLIPYSKKENSHLFYLYQAYLKLNEIDLAFDLMDIFAQKTADILERSSLLHDAVEAMISSRGYWIGYDVSDDFCLRNLSATHFERIWKICESHTYHLVNQPLAWQSLGYLALICIEQGFFDKVLLILKWLIDAENKLSYSSTLHAVMDKCLKMKLYKDAEAIFKNEKFNYGYTYQYSLGKFIVGLIKGSQVEQAEQLLAVSSTDELIKHWASETLAEFSRAYLTLACPQIEKAKEMAVIIDHLPIKIDTFMHIANTLLQQGLACQAFDLLNDLLVIDFAETIYEYESKWGYESSREKDPNKYIESSEHAQMLLKVLKAYIKQPDNVYSQAAIEKTCDFACKIKTEKVQTEACLFLFDHCMQTHQWKLATDIVICLGDDLQNENLPKIFNVYLQNRQFKEANHVAQQIPDVDKRAEALGYLLNEVVRNNLL